MKTQLRQRLLAVRTNLLPDEVNRDSKAVCRRLSEWPVFQNVQTVLAYLAFRNEISLQPLIDAHHEKTWALPRTLPDRLVIHQYQPGRLERHRFGMNEPAADAPLIPLEQIGMMLVPGVCFDTCGGRIGFGGGYYDRLLCRLDAIRVGIAHTACIVQEAPCEAHDCRMDWLVSPDGIQQVSIRAENSR
ncbi:MAG: 5-formyltetrahydrofolate cyclo-ligase [Anaerolineales bacterium]|nr:5-formyltetrahydrofolate cyclo-ligase [Anaerolineales bacterium]